MVKLQNVPGETPVFHQGPAQIERESRIGVSRDLKFPFFIFVTFAKVLNTNRKDFAMNPIRMPKKVKKKMANCRMSRGRRQSLRNRAHELRVTRQVMFYLSLYYGIQEARQIKMEELEQKRREAVEELRCLQMNQKYEPGRFFHAVPDIKASSYQGERIHTSQLPLAMHDLLDRYAMEAKCSKQELIEVAFDVGLDQAVVELQNHTAGRSRNHFEAYMEKVLSISGEQ